LRELGQGFVATFTISSSAAAILLQVQDQGDRSSTSLEVRGSQGRLGS
jgi:hypothetical protein